MPIRCSSSNGRFCCSMREIHWNIPKACTIIPFSGFLYNPEASRLSLKDAWQKQRRTHLTWENLSMNQTHKGIERFAFAFCLTSFCPWAFRQNYREEVHALRSNMLQSEEEARKVRGLVMSHVSFHSTAAAALSSLLIWHQHLVLLCITCFILFHILSCFAICMRRWYVYILDPKNFATCDPCRPQRHLKNNWLTYGIRLPNV